MHTCLTVGIRLALAVVSPINLGYSHFLPDLLWDNRLSCIPKLVLSLDLELVLFGLERIMATRALHFLGCPFIRQ